RGAPGSRDRRAPAPRRRSRAGTARRSRRGRPRALAANRDARSACARARRRECGGGARSSPHYIPSPRGGDRGGASVENASASLCGGTPMSFDLDRFTADLRAALRERSRQALREVVARAVSEPASLLKRIGAPEKGAVQVLHDAPDLTVLNVV